MSDQVLQLDSLYVCIGSACLPCLCIVRNRSWPMQDLLMLLFTAVFFAAAFLYVKACQKLR